MKDPAKLVVHPVVWLSELQSAIVESQHACGEVWALGCSSTEVQTNHPLVAHRCQGSQQPLHSGCFELEPATAKQVELFRAAAIYKLPKALLDLAQAARATVPQRVKPVQFCAVACITNLSYWKDAALHVALGHIE